MSRHINYKFYFSAVVFALLGLLSGNGNIYAQEKNVCDSLLTQIESNYNYGNFDEALTSIFNCLDRPEITQDQKMQAYRFLGLIYIAKDYVDDAKKAVAKLLDLLPNYEPDPVQDPPPYRNLVREQKALLIVNNEKKDEITETEEFYLSANLGAVLPVGDFGTTDQPKSGFANTGICLDASFFYTLDDYIIWSSSVTFALNGISESSLEESIRNTINAQFPNVFKNIKASTGSYNSTWIMSGLGTMLPVSPKINVYANGQIGLLLASYPDINVTLDSNSFTQTFNLGTSFAYAFSAGAIINKINVAVKYLRGSPEYVETVEGTTSKVNFPMSVLTITVGYVF